MFIYLYSKMTTEPLLPGFKFDCKQGKDHHLRQQFNFKNGYSIPKLDLESITFNEPQAFETTFDFIKYDPLEKFTKISKPKPSVYKPHFVVHDGKCLSFQGYFRQDVSEFSDEKHFYRKINIIYYLEDDTMTIIEPPVSNVGYLQGRIVRRGRIPKPHSNNPWHWKDLNVGIDIQIYGITYHISSCDLYTREYLFSQGIEVNENEDIPKNTFQKDYPMRKLSCYYGTQDVSQDKLYKFLQYDRKVLRFYALWDDRENEFGDLRYYKVHYYLIDDTVEVMQIKNKFKQNEPFTRLLSRTRLPKNYASGSVLKLNDSVSYCSAYNQEYYEPKDFRIGSSISILGREFFFYDCDQFTRRYYKDCLKIEQPAPISICETPPTKIVKEIPPHTGIGQPEDTLQSCLSIVPKPPKKDIIHYIENTNKMLRYSAKMDTTSEIDKNRKFIIQFSLADGKISIYEIKSLNSGFRSGYFLKSALVPKSVSTEDKPDYYSPSDFAIDSIIEIFGRKFVITGADLAVYRYMEQRPQKFNPDVIDSVKRYLQREGIIDEVADKIENVKLEED